MYINVKFNLVNNFTEDSKQSLEDRFENIIFKI